MYSLSGGPPVPSRQSSSGSVGSYADSASQGSVPQQYGYANNMDYSSPLQPQRTMSHMDTGGSGSSSMAGSYAPAPRQQQQHHGGSMGGGGGGANSYSYMPAQGGMGSSSGGAYSNYSVSPSQSKLQQQQGGGAPRMPSSSYSNGMANSANMMGSSGQQWSQPVQRSSNSSIGSIGQRLNQSAGSGTGGGGGGAYGSGGYQSSSYVPGPSSSNLSSLPPMANDTGMSE